MFFYGIVNKIVLFGTLPKIMAIKAKGAIAVFETILVIPIFIILFIFICEIWKYFYWQNALEQTVNYTVNLWAKSNSPDCSNLNQWLKQDIMSTALTKYSIDPDNISIETEHNINCNCSGSMISVKATLINWSYKYFANPPSAYALAIKEGAIGENC